MHENSGHTPRRGRSVHMRVQVAFQCLMSRACTNSNAPTVASGSQQLRGSVNTGGLEYVDLDQPGA